MGEKYQEDVLRKYPLSIIKAWHEGNKELKKWIDFGFFNTLFVSKNGWVTVYYNIEEVEKYWKILNEKLTEDLFNQMCDYFFELIRKAKETDSEEKVFGLYIEMWPIFILFDELSKYPEIGKDSMIRRLIRIRQTMHDISFIENRLDQSGPKDYIYHKEKLHFISFEQFLKENDIEIVNEP